MASNAMNLTTRTTAISRAYRPWPWRGCMSVHDRECGEVTGRPRCGQRARRPFHSAKVPGSEVETVQLGVEGFLWKPERFARRRCVASVPPQHLLDEGAFE